jgi:hypothetical protein
MAFVATPPLAAAVSNAPGEGDVAALVALCYSAACHAQGTTP